MQRWAQVLNTHHTPVHALRLTLERLHQGKRSLRLIRMPSREFGPGTWMKPPAAGLRCSRLLRRGSCCALKVAASRPGTTAATNFPFSWCWLRAGYAVDGTSSTMPIQRSPCFDVCGGNKFAVATVTLPWRQNTASHLGPTTIAHIAASLSACFATPGVSEIFNNERRTVGAA